MKGQKAPLTIFPAAWIQKAVGRSGIYVMFQGNRAARRSGVESLKKAGHALSLKVLPFQP